jgi:hypothetical protein
VSEEWDPDLAFVRLPQSGPFTNSAGLNNRLASWLAAAKYCIRQVGSSSDIDQPMYDIVHGVC